MLLIGDLSNCPQKKCDVSKHFDIEFLFLKVNIKKFDNIFNDLPFLTPKSGQKVFGFAVLRVIWIVTYSCKQIIQIQNPVVNNKGTTH